MQLCHTTFYFWLKLKYSLFGITPLTSQLNLTYNDIVEYNFRYKK